MMGKEDRSRDNVWLLKRRERLLFPCLQRKCELSVL